MTKTQKHESTKFPPGFRTYTQKDRDAAPHMQAKPPVVTLGKSGYLIFNAPGTIMLTGERGQNEAVSLAYNATSRVLAVKPVRFHRKTPDTFKISRMGEYKRHGSISFKLMSRVWGIPLTGTRHLCKWTGEMILIELDEAL